MRTALRSPDASACCCTALDKKDHSHYNTQQMTTQASKGDMHSLERDPCLSASTGGLGRREKVETHLLLYSKRLLRGQDY